MKKFKHSITLVALACMLSFTFVGCGNSDNNSTSGNNTSTENNEMGNAMDDAANDVGNMVEDTVDDVVDGAENVVDDLTGQNGFENYQDAHDYFLETMNSYHPESKFEIRNEDKELNDFQEGSRGYHFYLYDTSADENGKLFGEFFVDADSGMIYRKDNNNITEYRIKNSMNDANDTNRNNNNTDTNKNGNTTGNKTNNTENDTNNTTNNNAN